MRCLNLEEDIDILSLAEKFINGLAVRRLAKHSMRHYHAEVYQIVKFANNKGVHFYYKGLSDDYLQFLNERYDAGEIKYETQRFKIRVLRMFVSLVEKGEIDFSRRPVEQKKYILAPDLEKLVFDVLEYSDIQENGYDYYKYHIRHILYYSIENGCNPYELNDDILIDYICDKAQTTYRGSSSAMMRSVRCVAKFYQDHNIGDIRYAYQDINVKGNCRKLLPPFDQGEVKAMIECLETDNPIDRRNRAMILLGYTTGLRSVDVLNLKTTDLNLDKHTITIRQSKTGVMLTITPPVITWNAIVDYIINYRPSNDPGYIFMTGKSFYKEIGYGLKSMIMSVEKRAGVEHKYFRGFHGLRRSFAISLVSTGARIETVSEMLGHTSTSCDKKYLTFDLDKIQFVALDFTDVPIRSRNYKQLIDISNRKE